MTRMEFELAYFEAAVQHYYATKSSPLTVCKQMINIK